MALCSSKQPSTTTLSITTFIIFFLLSLPHSTHASSPNDFVGSSLGVSPTKFANSAKEVITVLQKVSSILSPFTNTFSHHSFLSNAISDCFDLLDMSSDQLSWSVSATQNPTGKNNSTGNLSSDLRTWLSAVLVNADTCLEGLQGLDVTFAKGGVSSGLDRVMSLVKKNLFEVVLSNDQLATATGKDRFPSWINDGDKKFLEANEMTADAIVAADGSGNYTTVMDAVSAAPKFSMKRYVIYVKKGVYVENVEIDRKRWNIMMIGEGMDATFISGSRNHVDGWTTFRSATFAVNGRGFIAYNISFQNTAGPEKEQAVALRSDSDLSVFYRCGIFGYQDSLYTHTNRQFYKECKITGTVDFIFGNGTVMFQDCEILAKKGMQGQKNTVTAHGRTDPIITTGFSFQFCNISADFDLLPFTATIPTFLGRPWRPYSRTIFMQSYMSNAISPEGWLEYNGSVGLDTLYYSEYMNSGPGAGVANRVKWSGYHVMNDSSEAEKFTVAQFILGDLWLPSAGVTYTAGLTV